MPDAALVGGDPFEVEHLSTALAAADVVVADAFDAQLRRVDERRRSKPLCRLLVDPLPALVATVAGAAELPAVAALERSPERSILVAYAFNLVDLSNTAKLNYYIDQYYGL